MKNGILTFHSQLNYVPPLTNASPEGRLRGVRRIAVLGAEDGAGGMGHKVAIRAENLHALTFGGRKWYNIGS